jgi:hypothetical protein
MGQGGEPREYKIKRYVDDAVSWIRKSVVCQRTGGYEVLLRFNATYEVIPGRDADKYDLLRLVDESGEDYLYPKSIFSMTQ